MYDSSMGELEALIQRHAPKIMASSAVLEHDDISAPSKRITPRKAWRVCTPDMEARMVEMAKQGHGPVHIASELRVNDSLVRTYLSKNWVKNKLRNTKGLREGSACGVSMVKTKAQKTGRIKIK